MPGEPAGKPKASTDFRLDGGAHSAEGTAVTPSVDRREGRIAAALTPPKRMPEGALLIACSSKHPANTPRRSCLFSRPTSSDRMFFETPREHGSAPFILRSGAR